MRRNGICLRLLDGISSYVFLADHRNPITLFQARASSARLAWCLFWCSVRSKQAREKALIMKQSKYP